MEHISLGAMLADNLPGRIASFERNGQVEVNRLLKLFRIRQNRYKRTKVLIIIVKDWGTFKEWTDTVVSSVRKK